MNFNSRADPNKRDAKKKLKQAINSKSDFKQFLESKKCYGRFIRNVIKQNHVNGTIQAIENNCTNHYIINSSINWRNTPEGYAFWVNIATN